MERQIYSGVVWNLSEILVSDDKSFPSWTNILSPSFTRFSQKASISELKALLDEEREQRREEREKAVADLKASIQKIQAAAQEELRQLSDASIRREKEQQEVINKLQVWKLKYSRELWSS